MSGVLGLIIIIAAIVGLLYILWRPEWVVVLIIVLFPAEQLLTAYFPMLGGGRSWIINVVTGCLALLAVGMRFAKGEAPYRGYWNKATVALMCLYGFMLVSLLWSPSRGDALGYVRAGYPYWGLYVVLMPPLIRDTLDLRRIMTGVMVVGCIVTALILLNPRSVFQSGRLMVDVGMFSTSERGNPLVLATMGSMMALAGVFIRYDRRSSILMLLRIASVILGFGLAIGSGSRGQVIAVALVGLMFFPLSRRLQNPKQFFLTTIGLLAIAGIGLITMKLFISHENVERWSVESLVSGFGQRFELVLMLFNAWFGSPAHWVVGLGANAFSNVYGEQAYVHNLMMEILGEEGLLGLALLLMILLSTYKSGVSQWRRHRDDPSLRSVTALIGAICVYAFLLSLKQGSFIGMPFPFYWWVVLVKMNRREQLEHVEEEAYEDESDPQGALRVDAPTTWPGVDPEIAEAY
jgi:hypothetical protein